MYKISHVQVSTDLSVCLCGFLSGTVRIKPLLNKSEQEFVASRRNTVLKTLKKLQIPCSPVKHLMLYFQRLMLK